MADLVRRDPLPEPPENRKPEAFTDSLGTIFLRPARPGRADESDSAAPVEADGLAGTTGPTNPSAQPRTAFTSTTDPVGPIDYLASTGSARSSTATTPGRVADIFRRPEDQAAPGDVGTGAPPDAPATPIQPASIFLRPDSHR